MFNVGDKILTIYEGEIIKGDILSIYYEIKIAIVRLEGGNTIKIHFDNMALIKEEIEDDQDIDEPSEKSEITITKDKFVEITLKLIDDEAKDRAMLRLAFSLFCSRLYKAFFVDEGDNA